MTETFASLVKRDRLQKAWHEFEDALDKKGIRAQFTNTMTRENAFRTSIREIGWPLSFGKSLWVQIQLDANSNRLYWMLVVTDSVDRERNLDIDTHHSSWYEQDSAIQEIQRRLQLSDKRKLVQEPDNGVSLESDEKPKATNSEESDAQKKTKSNSESKMAVITIRHKRTPTGWETIVGSGKDKTSETEAVGESSGALQPEANLMSTVKMTCQKMREAADTEHKDARQKVMMIEARAKTTIKWFKEYAIFDRADKVEVGPDWAPDYSVWHMTGCDYNLWTSNVRCERATAARVVRKGTTTSVLLEGDPDECVRLLAALLKAPKPSAK
jgi:hypothetical protein